MLYMVEGCQTYRLDWLPKYEIVAAFAKWYHSDVRSFFVIMILCVQVMRRQQELNTPNHRFRIVAAQIIN